MQQRRPHTPSFGEVGPCRGSNAPALSLGPCILPSFWRATPRSAARFLRCRDASACNGRGAGPWCA